MSKSNTKPVTVDSSLPKPEEMLAWVDLETFGLNPKTDPIIEIGIMLTTFDLDVVMDYSALVWDEKRAARYAANDPADKYIIDMHNKSELWQDITDLALFVSTPDEAFGRAVDFLSDYGITPKVSIPMCGSSVHFDRAMLAEQAPELHNVFGYRNIDISSIKELCKRINPAMYEHLSEDVSAKRAHRVLPDLDDTLNEAEWYFDNFLHHTLEAIRPNEKLYRR